MSNQVFWELTKHNNAFLVKNNGFTFSRDPFNPTGKNQYSHCGKNKS